MNFLLSVKVFYTQYRNRHSTNRKGGDTKVGASSLGTKVRHLREVRNLTLQEVSKLSGIPVTTIHGVESGKTPDPKLSTILKLSEALRVDVHYFINPDARTPLQVAEHLPEDIRKFIIEEDSMPYLEISEEAKRMGVPVEGVAAMVRALGDAMRNKRK
jgi:transcriptional regulator with XRE-family HTH domain